MNPLAHSIGQVAPLYNLALVTVVVILLVVLLRKKTKLSLFAWKVMFFIVMVYVMEEILTVLHKFSIIYVPRITMAILELVMLTTFLFMVLNQREEVKKLK